MKIIEQYNPEGVPLGEIPSGELFIYSGSYYMRVHEDSTLNDTISQGVDLLSLAVAIDMATGALSTIPKGQRVPPIYSRIRINGRAD